MTLHRLIIISSLALLVATSALAHGGHKHQFLGTVKSLQEDRLVITTVDKTEATFVLTSRTAISASGRPASRAELKEGTRVSVYVENDGRTAATIKIGGGRK